MAKFNQHSKPSGLTYNNEGHLAYSMDDRTKLVTMTLTSMFGEQKFYGDNSGELVRLAESVDMDFVARLAVYARKEMHLRSVAHALCAVIARYGKEYTRKVVAGVIERADDIAEILAAYLSLYGKPVPNALKKALSDALNNFGEYALAKYKGEQNELKLRDVVLLVHPKPKDDAQSELFKKLLEGTLETPYTWETQLSERGNTRKVWEELIQSGQVGYMALLRNLRNIIESGARNLGTALERIADRDAVLKSKQLPFRYYSTYRALQEAKLMNPSVRGALETAAAYSIDNIERIPGSTLVAIDVSGSMKWPISGKGGINCADIARMLAVLSVRICERSTAVAFDNELYPLNVKPTGSIFAQVEAIPVNGGGTDIRLPLKYALDNRLFFSRMILLSDNEINSSYNGYATCQTLANEYRKKVNPNFFVHAIDLMGYGTQQFKGPQTNIIAVWSERVLSFIPQVEYGMENLTEVVGKYEGRTGEGNVSFF